MDSSRSLLISTNLVLLLRMRLRHLRRPIPQLGHPRYGITPHAFPSFSVLTWLRTATSSTSSTGITINPHSFCVQKRLTRTGSEFYPRRRLPYQSITEHVKSRTCPVGQYAARKADPDWRTCCGKNVWFVPAMTSRRCHSRRGCRYTGSGFSKFGRR